METLEALHRRLKMAGELGGLVRTMKALAAVNIRHYLQVLAAVEQSRRSLDLALRMALTRDPALLTTLESPPIAGRRRAGNPATLVLIGTDRGMCGPFNERVIAHAQKEPVALPGRGARVLAVGHRLERPCETAGLAITARTTLPGSARGITPTVESIIVQYDAWRGESAGGELLVVHNRPLETTGYVSHTVHLFPVNPRWLRRLTHLPWPTRSIPMSPSPGPELLTGLVRRHVLLSLHQALAESLASEHAARLTAMQVAEQNVEEHESRLSSEFNRRRQHMVDEELLDLISGYRALTESAMGETLVDP